jgi:hypothetical protein
MIDQPPDVKLCVPRSEPHRSVSPENEEWKDTSEGTARTLAGFLSLTLSTIPEWPTRREKPATCPKRAGVAENRFSRVSQKMPALIQERKARLEKHTGARELSC